MVMRLKELRKSAGITQECLAVQMGVKQAAVSAWETERAFPCARDVPKLAKVLGCSISELYCPEEEVS